MSKIQQPQNNDKKKKQALIDTQTVNSQCATVKIQTADI